MTERTIRTCQNRCRDIETFLSCATACLLVTTDLFDGQSTTIVIVLFVAEYLLRVETVFTHGLQSYRIALLFFFNNNFAGYPETVRRKTYCFTVCCI